MAAGREREERSRRGPRVGRLEEQTKRDALPHYGEEGTTAEASARIRGFDMTVIDRFRSLVPRRGGLVLASTGVGVTVATHLAVLIGVLPHTEVNGGRVHDPGRGREIAVGSLLTQVPVVVLVARSARRAGRTPRAERVAMGVLAAAYALSTPVQLSGTRFERAAMAPTAAALAVGFARLSLGRDN